MVVGKVSDMVVLVLGRICLGLNWGCMVHVLYRAVAPEAAPQSVAVGEVEAMYAFVVFLPYLEPL